MGAPWRAGPGRRVSAEGARNGFPAGLPRAAHADPEAYPLPEPCLSGRGGRSGGGGGGGMGKRSAAGLGRALVRERSQGQGRQGRQGRQGQGQGRAGAGWVGLRDKLRLAVEAGRKSCNETGGLHPAAPFCPYLPPTLPVGPQRNSYCGGEGAQLSFLPARPGQDPGSARCHPLGSGARHVQEQLWAAEAARR